MSDFASHALIRLAAYPAFYWIGFAVVKTLSFGRADILPYSELGQDEDAAWWEFRVRRDRLKSWRPESMIIIGGCAVLAGVSGYYTFRYLL